MLVIECRLLLKAAFLQLLNSMEGNGFPLKRLLCLLQCGWFYLGLWWKVGVLPSGMLLDGDNVRRSCAINGATVCSLKLLLFTILILFTFDILSGKSSDLPFSVCTLNMCCFGFAGFLTTNGKQKGHFIEK